MLIVFVIVQLTTTSTTGIIVTIIYFALNFIVVKKNKAIKIVLIQSLLYFLLWRYLICLWKKWIHHQEILD